MDNDFVFALKINFGPQRGRLLKDFILHCIAYSFLFLFYRPSREIKTMCKHRSLGSTNTELKHLMPFVVLLK